MKTRKHNCPYLKNNRYCSHKSCYKLRTKKKVDCTYNKCEDCLLWKKCPTNAERLILTPLKRLKAPQDDEGER